MFLFVMGFATITQAQRPKADHKIETEKDSSRIKGKRPPLSIFNPPDTFDIKVYYAHHPQKKHLYPDTLLGYYFQQSKPNRQHLIDYANLGSLGTPARPILFDVKERKGLQLGFHQFDIYDRPVDSIRYFKVNRTFTDTYYAQGATQDDFIFKSTFSRNLSSAFNLSVDYLRISHVGFYKRQKSRHTTLAINGAYQHKKGKYSSFFSYSYNDFQQEDNGGIEDESLFGNSFYDDRSTFPVFLNQANTRKEEQIISYSQYYNLQKTKKDSSNISNKRNITLGHQFLFSPGDYKFYDTTLDTDSIYYQNIQVDNRGLRHYLNWNKIENTFKISTFKNLKNQLSPKDFLSVGITHTYQKTYQEPIDTVINTLIVFGEWEWNPISYISLHSYANYNLGSHQSEYIIKSDLNIHLKKLGLITGHVLHQRFSPDLLQKKLFISFREFYNNDFKKPITTSIKTSYHLPITKTTFSFQYHLLHHYIYYDTLFQAQQADVSINVLQFILDQNIKLGAFGMENTIAFQTTNNTYIRLPKISLKNSIFVEGLIFKKVMLARMGFDFRMNTSYFADNYMPATGQFHLQDDVEIKLYPALDFFTSFKVKTLRAFAKIENVTGWFTNNIHYFTPRYPLPDPHFRFGVSWRFID